MASEDLDTGGKSVESQFPKLFYVTDSNDANNIIREYELKTVSKFITYRETRGFANSSPLSAHIENSNMKKGHKILWEDGTEITEKIPYDGIPYIILGSKIMDCMYGPDRTKTHKSTNTAELEKPDSGKERKKRTGGRKRDCPAQIYLREVHKFPEYKIPFSSAYNKRVASKRLRSALLAADEDLGERRIYIALPRLAAHRGHTIGQKNEEEFPLDRKVRDKIYELVYQRIFNTEELQARACAYVKDVLFKGRDPPPMTNSRYFPKIRVVKSYCYQARIRMRNQGMDAPLPKQTERTKMPGGQRKTLDGSSSRRDSLLQLVQPIREEEVDTTHSGYTKDNRAADNLTDIDSLLLDREFPSVEKTDCLAMLHHLTELTRVSNDRETLLGVKGHLLDAMNRFHSSTIFTSDVAEDPPTKQRRLQSDDAEGAPADQFIPLRIQRDPTSDRPVMVIDSENWPLFCQQGTKV